MRYDPPGVFRVAIPWTDWEGMLASAFEQIRLYAKADLAVSLRLLRALGDIASTTPDPTAREALYALGKRTVDGCEDNLGEEEMRQLRKRLTALESLTRAELPKST
jgi:uncharacterized membrane protein